MSGPTPTDGKPPIRSDLLLELPSAAWYWDVAADREVYSPEWKAMLGHAEHEIAESAAEWRSRVHPDDLARAVACARAALEPGAAPYADEYRMRHRDGSWRLIASRGAVVERDAAGRGVRMVGADRDITDLKVLALRVDEREALLAMAERLAGIGYWTWDPAADQVKWSRGMYLAYGLPPDGPAPRFADHPAMMSEDSFARLRVAVARAVEHGEPYSLELELRRPDGTTRNVIGIGERVISPSGAMRLWGAMYDVTEQRAEEIARARQQRLLGRMSELASIGGWSFDVDGGRLEWTDQTYRLHELPIGTPVTVESAIAFYAPAFRGRVVESLQSLMRSPDPCDFEARLVTATGREIWVRVVGEAEVVDGRTRRIFGTFQDITDAKDARARLAQAMEDLRARNRELQDFAVAASHDLQEPLRKIQSLGSLLSERFADSLDAGGRDLLERMRAAASRMGDLVGDLLAYSRVARQAPPPPPTDLAEVAAGVVADLEVEIQARGAQVDVGPLPTVCADPTQMRQVLQNLIGNALKYQSDGRAPRVQVDAELLDLPAVATGEIRSHCRLRVRDNGIGFEQRYAEQIFAPFQRLHDRSRYEGTGMGLAIVRRIAERHGGRVYARGKPDEGAEFVLELPVDGPPPPPDEAPAA
ncbi:MAG: PAS domain-containing protein [Xanthomonadaceae bacterium]|jgi:PAS domain S-box-containing protein|nr:PAS domain-containing protein [Xanthomonadaceae bacterium]